MTNIDAVTYLAVGLGLAVLLAARLLYWGPRLAAGNVTTSAARKNVRLTLIAVSLALSAFGLFSGLHR